MKLRMFGGYLTVIILSINFGLHAQDYVESAGVFSRVTAGGSARIQAMGGAQVALGGDYSSALSNPAGLGMFNHSEITLSPGFTYFNTTSKYLGNKDMASKPAVIIPGFSAVFNNTKNCDCTGFLGGSVGISLQRTNDFNQSYNYHGTNSNTSIIDDFVNNSNYYEYDTSQFRYPYSNQSNNQFNTVTGLGYNNYLFDYTKADGYYTSIKGIPVQRENIQLQGATNQFNISYGGNINDIFFFGAGIGIPFMNYKSSKVYQETFSADTLLNLKLTENLTIKGSGANITFGGIVRPVSFMQIGASYTSPTLYQVTDSWKADMGTDWKNGDSQYQYTDVITSNYSLVTPSKMSLGMAFISKYGLVSGDIETMNFASANYSSTTTDISFTDYNKDIKLTYRRVLNYKIGLEGRYSIFRIRGGYNLQGNAFKSQYDANNQIQSISGGVGVKTKKFSVDFALISSSSKNLYSPYLEAPTVSISNKITRGIITFGFTF